MLRSSQAIHQVQARSRGLLVTAPTTAASTKAGQRVQLTTARALHSCVQHGLQLSISTGSAHRASVRHLSTSSQLSLTQQLLHCKVQQLQQAYRQHGHLLATVNPLQSTQIVVSDNDTKALTVEAYGLDGSEVIEDAERALGMADTRFTVSDYVQHLRSVYSQHVAVHYTHLPSFKQQQWFTDKLEQRTPTPLSISQQRNILSTLLSCSSFDAYLSMKFPSLKRYGCEGLESMVVALEQLFSSAGEAGVENVVLGMPHRGRLNVLVSLLNYPAHQMFAKVKGQSLLPTDDHTCDVLSHIGTTVKRRFAPSNKEVTVSLINNPSHLEAVNPVSQGKTRAKQDELRRSGGSNSTQKVLNVQLHGDAAFAGQGIVTESLLLGGLPAFHCGGTVHIICNNQLGFTADSKKSRITRYASDLCKAYDMPTIVVNGEHMESVVHAVQLATEYQQTFGKDICIELMGYRRSGHNEVDEPAFTQPLMYKEITQRQSFVGTYKQELLQQQVVTPQFVQKVTDKYQQYLDKEFNEELPKYQPQWSQYFQGKWAAMQLASNVYETPTTGVDVDHLHAVGQASIQLPADFQIHPRLRKSFVQHRQALLSNNQCDYSMAEALAIGTLMQEGHNVRLVGQDVERGTFSHRHAVVVDQKTGSIYNTLQNSLNSKGTYTVANSPLSEASVVGYEYGYNTESPSTLSLCEMQFGDFIDGAQSMIDTFVSSSETKWLIQNGLVLLLPHGYDGAGPEHSSCRYERLLQMCDQAVDDMHVQDVNMAIANPTTPAQYFHLLRRQLHRDYRKPLVVVAPKTLLRHSQCISSLTDMCVNTKFQSVLMDDHVKPSSTVDTLVICSGKVYYDIHEQRQQHGRDNIACLRVEEISPFPWQVLQQHLQTYTQQATQIKRIVWFQEEPQNAGAYLYVQPRMQHLLKQMGLDHELEYVGRPPLAAPAAGNATQHKKQLAELWSKLLTAPQQATSDADVKLEILTLATPPKSANNGRKKRVYA